MLIVITIIGIMAGFSLVGIIDAQARGRDAERVADIDVLHSQLEQYYIDNGGYPATVNAALLPQLDPSALTDPDGESIDIRSPVANQTAANVVTVSDSNGPDYVYTAYPSGCSNINCRGYMLKSFIEQITQDVTNPYVRQGLHNN